MEMCVRDELKEGVESALRKAATGKP